MATRGISQSKGEPPLLMTFEEYLAWADEDTHVYIDLFQLGKIRIAPLGMHYQQLTKTATSFAEGY